MLERIKLLMKEQNVNKNKLAKLANLPATTIYSALASEESLQKTKLETIRAISKALKTTLDFIVFGTYSNQKWSPNKLIAISKNGEQKAYIVNDENVESSDDVDVVVDNGVTETKESLGVPTEYTAVYDVKATAYCLCKKCCGKSPDSPNYGMTSSGLRIVPGTGMKVIAVDDDIIPLGSEVYVEGLNGAVDYGYAIAADTGSAIKDYKIDLYMDTHQEAYRWGVKTVRLYVL